MINTPNFSYFKVVTRNKRPFLIRSMLKEDIEPCVELMAACHENYHPIMICIKFNKEIYTEMLRRRIHSVIDQDMSLVCVDVQAKKIIGVCLGSDVASRGGGKSMEDLFQKYPEFKHYREIVAVFDKKFAEYYKPSGPGKVAYPFYLTVNPKYQSFGLATHILKAVIEEHPKYLPYDVIIGGAVSNHTPKIGYKLNQMVPSRVFRVADACEYETFVSSDGTKPFANIKEELTKRNMEPEHLYYTLVLWERPSLKPKL
mmetsp:Transcript_36167/g.42281  ORF Transcript_36167/g.42281 Transcript_36167/m.42281 type:complete len:257 (+) Transcript_36167:41-811(+)